MLLGGLWHGANLTFIVWGAWHGGLLAVERWLGIGNPVSSRARTVRLPLTMLLVILGWVLFRAPNFATALDLYSGMLGWNGVGIRPEVDWQLSREGLAVMFIGIVLVYIEPWLRRVVEEGQLAVKAGWASEAIATATAVAAIIAVLRISDQSYSPFLYFQF
jgi:alginate O-acetyltransferase complex protein AlgI